MKKLRSFSIAAALLLIMAGVLGGKLRFSGTYAIYGCYGSTCVPLTPFVFLSDDLTTTQAGQQATIVTSSSGGFWTLWGFNTTTGYVKLYTTF